MCVLIFCTTAVCNIFPSEKKWARYDQKSSKTDQQDATDLRPHSAMTAAGSDKRE
jgi:hypothetical protein